MNISMTLFRREFEAFYNRWVNNTNDDRELFCRQYVICMQDMEYMKRVNNLTIQCVMMAEFDSISDDLREIVSYFTGQTPRGIDGGELTFFVDEDDEEW